MMQSVATPFGYDSSGQSLPTYPPRLAVFAATRCLVEFFEIPVDAFSFEGTLPPAVISMAHGWSV